jgi:hypothetical protein
VQYSQLTTGQKAQLLAEVEDLIRTMPPCNAFPNQLDEALAWLGRAGAAIQQADIAKSSAYLVASTRLRANNLDQNVDGAGAVKTLLHEVRSSLRFEIGHLSVAVSQGQVFDYFDEIRKVLATARADLLVVDPYLDVDFVSSYLPQVASSVAVRMLCGRAKLLKLLPAVNLFATQSGLHVSIRSSEHIHDRFVFVDRRECYQSGASFKDGAKNSPAIITQITDAFTAMWSTYENLWNDGRVER